MKKTLKSSLVEKTETHILQQENKSQLGKNFPYWVNKQTYILWISSHEERDFAQKKNANHFITPMNRFKPAKNFQLGYLRNQ